MKIIQGEEIKDLILQRSPMILIDTFYRATETEAETGLTITDSLMFCSDGFFSEPGLVEHIAQSASALAGYKAKVRNEPKPIGYIGEVKKFHIHFLPRTGDTLHTHIQIVSEVGGISLLTAETKVNEAVAAQGKMKIFNTI